MYNIPYFKDPDNSRVLSFIRQYPFATLIGCAPGMLPVATQLPLFIDEVNGKIFLTGHMMRKTDHHQAFEINPESLVLFTGPHTYVSASWYTDPKQASTWNYMSVHARGKIAFLGDNELLQVLERTTTHFENNPGSPAGFHELSTDYVFKMIKAIVAFQIEVVQLDHIFKLSQNRDEQSKINIIAELNQRGDQDSLLIASEMSKRMNSV